MLLNLSDYVEQFYKIFYLNNNRRKFGKKRDTVRGRRTKNWCTW